MSLGRRPRSVGKFAEQPFSTRCADLAADDARVYWVFAAGLVASPLLLMVDTLITVDQCFGSPLLTRAVIRHVRGNALAFAPAAVTSDSFQFRTVRNSAHDFSAGRDSADARVCPLARSWLPSRTENACPEGTAR